MLCGEKGLLWCIEKDGAIITAQLENYGTHGLQVRVLWDGQVYFANFYRTRNEALMTSEQLRLAFNANDTVH